MKPLIIQSRSVWHLPDFGELWRFRELLASLIVRDIRVRYKQTILGALWAFLQPLITMLIFTIVFSRFARFPSNGYPYAVFVLTGILPWLLFSGIVTASSNSVITSANLVKKIYFPRMFLPLSSVGVYVLDFVLAFVLLMGLLLYFDIGMSTRYLVAPILLLPICLLAVGIGAFLSSLIVLYRDIRFLVPFLIQSLFFLTPVIYPSSIIPARYSWISLVNPMSGYIETFRSLILHTKIDYSGLAFSVAISIIVFMAGVSVFSALEDKFIDVI